MTSTSKPIITLTGWVGASSEEIQKPGSKLFYCTSSQFKRKLLNTKSE